MENLLEYDYHLKKKFKLLDQYVTELNQIIFSLVPSIVDKGDRKIVLKKY